MRILRMNPIQGLILFCSYILCGAMSLSGQVDSLPRANAVLKRLPLAFVENQGQWDTAAQFVARQGGLTARLEPDALVIQVVGKDEDSKVRGAVVKLAFEGCRKGVTLEGEKRLPGRNNYFIGNDPERWRSGVARYRSVLYRDLYDGIDIRVREGKGGILEYDVLVAPKTDLKQVALHVEGAEGLRIAKDGSLVIETAVGPLTQPVPRTWQVGADGTKQEVACRYVRLASNRFGFVVAGRDRAARLTIDPGLIWSTFLGGNSTDIPYAISVDPSGVVTVAGYTLSTNFPQTPGAYQTTLNGTIDGFVSRLDPRQSGAAQLVYSTFLGGNGLERVDGLHVDPAGVVTVAGLTGSTNFPVTNNSSYNGGFSDAFVSRLDPRLTGKKQLVYSTFLGGSGRDHANRLSVDANNVVTVVGMTQSTDFPWAPGAYDTTHNGGEDAFVSRLDPSLPVAKQLVYSTFLGGSGNELGSFAQQTALWVDPSGLVTVAGWTNSTNFPTTPGTYDTTHNGSDDVFVSRLDPRLTGNPQLVYSTFLGGQKADSAFAVSVRSSDEITVAGHTSSSDFPTTNSAFDTTFNGWIDVIVSRLDLRKTGTQQLVYSTFLGGGSSETAFALHVDSTGVMTMAGRTSSTGFPHTPGAFNTTFNGGIGDAFVSRLDPRRPGHWQLVYSTFLGGSGNEQSFALALDANGAAVVAGETGSSDFPVTPGAFDTTHNGGTDVFVTKLAMTCIQGSGSIAPGGTVDLDLFAPGDSGLYYQAASSLGTGPIPIGNRTIGLGLDILLYVSLNGYWPTLFDDYCGTIDAWDQAKAHIHIPNDKALTGLKIHSAFVTLDPSAPQGIKSISDTFSFMIQ